jgi:Prolipoprotein diacylglyceryl transferase
MSIGSLAIPMPALIFMVSVAVVFLVGWLTEKRAGSIEFDALMILAAGLIAARIAFVIRFLPQYRHAPLAVFDIRDLGFDPLVGLIAGALVAAWRMARNRRTRAPLGLALTAGLATFVTAQALTGDRHVPSTIPAVELQALDGTPRSLDTQDTTRISLFVGYGAVDHQGHDDAGWGRRCDGRFCSHFD